MSERLLNILIDSFPKMLIPGLTMTIPLTALAFSFAMVIAVSAAVVQFARVPVLTQLCRLYIWIFRGTPLLVQLFVVFFGLPDLGIVLEPFPTAVLVFSLVEGEQLEAGYCVGMSYLQTMRRIILPQAMRTAFPSLSNSLIAMVKDTSLAANITVTEMFMATQRIAARTYEHLALYMEVGLIYLMFSTVLTWLQQIGEKKLGAYETEEG